MNSEPIGRRSSRTTTPPNADKWRPRSFLRSWATRNLERVSFLDIGSGSGLHSLAAFDAKATRIHSFDFDPLSVKTTGKLRQLAGQPPNWTVELRRRARRRLSSEARLVESRLFVGSAPSYRRNVAGDRKCGAQSGAGRSLLHRPLFIECRPTIRGILARREASIQHHQSPGTAPDGILVHLAVRDRPQSASAASTAEADLEKKKGRGIDYMTDVRDWLGGWPMEFADDQAVVNFLKEKFDFELVRMSTGEACTEFLFPEPKGPVSRIVQLEQFQGKWKPVFRPELR